jgi:hypothetical protein
MAITRGATVTVGVDSATPIIATLAHTVDASTTLLIVTFHCEGDLGISAVNWNTTEAMTEISSVTTSASGGDCRVYVFGRINPTVTAANVTWTVADAGDNLAVVCVNYLGTDTSDVATATNAIDTEDNGNAAATTVPLTGTTTSGSTLYVAGTFYGGDGNPSSETTASFTTVREGETGTSTTTDTCYFTGEKIAGGTGGTVSPTIDWTGSASDECVGLFIEILPPLTEFPGVGLVTAAGLVPGEYRELNQGTVTGIVSTGTLSPVVTGVVFPGVGAVATVEQAPTIASVLTVLPGVGSAIAEGRVPGFAGILRPHDPNLLTELKQDVGVGSVNTVAQLPGEYRELNQPVGVGLAVTEGRLPTVSGESGVEGSTAPGSGLVTTGGLAPTLEKELVQEVGLGSAVIQGLLPTAVGDGEEPRGHVRTRDYGKGYIPETTDTAAATVVVAPPPPVFIDPPHASFVVDTTAAQAGVARLEVNQEARRARIARMRREEEELIAILMRAA